MPDIVIDRIHSLARQQKINMGLIFLDRNRQPILDDELQDDISDTDNQTYVANNQDDDSSSSTNSSTSSTDSSFHPDDDNSSASSSSHEDDRSDHHETTAPIDAIDAPNIPATDTEELPNTPNVEPTPNTADTSPTEDLPATPTLAEAPPTAGTQEMMPDNTPTTTPPSVSDNMDGVSLLTHMMSAWPIKQLKEVNAR